MGEQPRHNNDQREQPSPFHEQDSLFETAGACQPRMPRSTWQALAASGSEIISSYGGVRNRASLFRASA